MNPKQYKVSDVDSFSHLEKKRMELARFQAETMRCNIAFWKSSRWPSKPVKPKPKIFER